MAQQQPRPQQQPVYSPQTTYSGLQQGFGGGQPQTQFSGQPLTQQPQQVGLQSQPQTTQYGQPQGVGQVQPTQTVGQPPQSLGQQAQTFARPVETMGQPPQQLGQSAQQLGQPPQQLGQPPQTQPPQTQQGQTQAGVEFEDSMSSEVRAALHDLNKVKEIGEWCGNLCIDEGPQMAQCVRVCRDLSELADVSTKLITRNSIAGPTHINTFIGAAEQGLQELRRHQSRHVVEMANVVQRAIDSSYKVLNSIAWQPQTTQSQQQIPQYGP